MSTTEQSPAAVAEGASFGGVQARSAAAINATSRISVRNLDFFYGDSRALKQINLELPDRQVTGMIGPSGCGKSTLLRVLNRMYSLYPGQRAVGEVIMDGRNMLDADVDLNELRAKVGMVFQKPTPFPMTIYENVAFGVRLHEKMSKSQMDDRVEWALSRAAIWGEVKDRLHTSALGLSGGQQQRLCIARTIAVRPEVILFDEPTSALDPAMAAEVMEVIVELARAGQTMVVVTHDHGFARRAASRVVELAAGRIARQGPAADML